MNVTDIGAILIGIIGAVWGIAQTLIERHDRKAGITRAEFDALKAALIELAYMRLAERHHRYMTRGWAHNNEKRVCERLYKAYHAIGGNGVGTKMNDQIQDLPSYAPGDEKDSDLADEEDMG